MNVKALLKQVPTTAYIISGAVVLLWGVWTANNYHQREIGKREIELAQTTAQLRSAKMALDSLGKQYRVDTIRLTKIRRVTDSLTVTVDQWKTDTLKVVEYVTKADSAIKTCSAALGTCEGRVGAAVRALVASEKANRILKASFPSKARPWLYGAAGLGIGVLAGKLIK